MLGDGLALGATQFSVAGLRVLEKMHKRQAKVVELRFLNARLFQIGEGGTASLSRIREPMARQIGMPSRAANAIATYSATSDDLTNGDATSAPMRNDGRFIDRATLYGHGHK